MTESFRRSGEYPQGQQQHSQSSYPGTPEAGGAFPPPPAYDPPQPVNAAPGSAMWPAPTPEGSPAPPAPPARRRRVRGPLGLLAAVAIAAAAVGGGTAYAFQELTGKQSTSASAGTAVVPTSRKGTVSGVAEAVSPAIVEINATSNAGSSTGSGVVITSDGEIVTNNHVVSGASTVKVRTSDGKTYTAEVVGTDAKKDLALIKLKDASGLKTASLGDSDNVKVGDEVVAIGSPRA